MSTIPPHVLHLTRTACLVESRAHLYSGYLASVFERRGPVWTDTFARWGAEEETHGQSLRAWLAREDPGFDFEQHMTDYLARMGPAIRETEHVNHVIQPSLQNLKHLLARNTAPASGLFINPPKLALKKTVIVTQLLLLNQSNRIFGILAP